MLVLLVFSFGLFSGSSGADVLADARQAIAESIEKNNALAPKYLRLIFHDCASPTCDGCIQMSSPDNKGLDIPIDALEAIYRPGGQDSDYSKAMSRADFWALASIVAIEYGVAQGQQGKEPVKPGEHGDFKSQYSMNPIAFTVGRRDCATSPDSPESDYLINAVKSSSEQLYKFFGDLGFSKVEAATLMSAHSFGKFFKEDAGVSMSWTLDSWRQLDVSWVHGLVDPAYDWEQDPDMKWRCVDRSSTTARDDRLCGFDLNVDIGVTRDIEPGPDGKVACPFRQCPEIEEIASKFREYNEDSTLWANEFAKVMQKLIDRKGNN